MRTYVGACCAVHQRLLGCWIPRWLLIFSYCRFNCKVRSGVCTRVMLSSKCSMKMLWRDILRYCADVALHFRSWCGYSYLVVGPFFPSIQMVWNEEQWVCGKKKIGAAGWLCNDDVMQWNLVDAPVVVFSDKLCKSIEPSDRASPKFHLQSLTVISPIEIANHYRTVQCG